MENFMLEKSLVRSYVVSFARISIVLLPLSSHNSSMPSFVALCTSFEVLRSSSHLRSPRLSQEIHRSSLDRPKPLSCGPNDKSFVPANQTAVQFVKLTRRSNVENSHWRWNKASSIPCNGDIKRRGWYSRNDTHSENIKSVSGYDSTFEGLATIIRRLTSFRSPTRAGYTNFYSILAFRKFLYERRLVDDRQIEKDQYSTRNSINNKKDRLENIT